MSITADAVHFMHHEGTIDAALLGCKGRATMR